MTDYPYAWSFNLSISPRFIMIRVWRGKYTWYAHQPLKIEHGYGV